MGEGNGHKKSQDSSFRQPVFADACIGLDTLGSRAAVIEDISALYSKQIVATLSSMLVRSAPSYLFLEIPCSVYLTDKFQLCFRNPIQLGCYSAAFPRDSKGSINTSAPAAMKRAPLVYTGAEVWRLANMATIG